MLKKLGGRRTRLLWLIIFIKLSDVEKIAGIMIFIVYLPPKAMFMLLWSLGHLADIHITAHYVTLGTTRIFLVLSP
jgi:hypothetical protein